MDSIVESATWLIFAATFLQTLQFWPELLCAEDLTQLHNWGTDAVLFIIDQIQIFASSGKKTWKYFLCGPEKLFSEKFEMVNFREEETKGQERKSGFVTCVLLNVTPLFLTSTNMPDESSYAAQNAAQRVYTLETFPPSGYTSSAERCPVEQTAMSLGSGGVWTACGFLEPHMLVCAF